MTSESSAFSDAVSAAATVCAERAADDAAMASATAAATVVHCCVRVEPMVFLVRKVIEISPCLIVAGCRVIRPRLVRLLRPISRRDYKFSAWTGALQFLYQPPIWVWRAGLSSRSK